MSKEKITKARENDLQDDIIRYETRLSEVKTEIDSKRADLFAVE